MRGPLLSFWSTTSDPEAWQAVGNPPSQAGVQQEFQPLHTNGIEPRTFLLVPGGPKMDYTNEPSPLRNPTNIIFWVLTTSKKIVDVKGTGLPKHKVPQKVF
jgi:hypothetical protein